MPARILIIEDNEANLDLMVYLLTAFGYPSATACDGEAGYETALGEEPDLIICDLQLPGIDGYEIARRLKADARFDRTPIVAVTAFAMVGDRDRVLAAGFDGYIPKPITPEIFVAQVEAFLPPDQLSGLTPSATDAEPDHSSSPIHRATILVVDDSHINLDLARNILEPHGYRMIAAGGMNEAFTLARQSPPDLILSDVNMYEGKEAGFDFIKIVKADSLLADIPFIFISSTYVDAEYCKRGLDLGAARFLVRPIEPQTLLDEIAVCLRERKER